MRAFTPEFVEREYNNRALVPDHPAYFARWERDSKFVRGTLACTLDLPYGPDARHRVDLFPAADPRGTLVFIHGGYWRSLDKSMFSWLASSWVAAGINVAIPNYRLCPAVRIEEIEDDVIAAVNWLMGSSPSPPGTSKHDGVGAEGRGEGGATVSLLVPPGTGKHDGVGAEGEIAPVPPVQGRAEGRVVIAGHSAGGHLTAAVFAAPRERLTFDTARIAGGVPISGIFDFEPMRHFSFNADFGLDEAAVARLAVHARRPTISAPLVIAAGGAESAEFQRQSHLLAQAWNPQVRSLLILPSLNHFSVVDAFAERGQPLYEEALALFRPNLYQVTNPAES